MMMEIRDDCVMCRPEQLDNGFRRESAQGRLVIYSAEPRLPVTAGHRMFFPNFHVRDAAEDPSITAKVMEHAAYHARRYAAFNLITSAGRSATQSVFHLHIHVVPRRPDDNLKLPWAK